MVPAIRPHLTQVRYREIPHASSVLSLILAYHDAPSRPAENEYDWAGTTVLSRLRRKRRRSRRRLRRRNTLPRCSGQCIDDAIGVAGYGTKRHSRGTHNRVYAGPCRKNEEPGQGGRRDGWAVAARGMNTRPGRWCDRKLTADHLVGRRGTGGPAIQRPSAVSAVEFLK